MRRLLPLLPALLLAVPVMAGAAQADEKAPTATFTLVNVEYEGSKIWLPGTITVKRGTRVKINLVNNTPSGQHGFAIPKFGVAAIVDKGQPQAVEFVASEAGIFPTICQLHPAHVGGQLVVLP